jgi:amphi-Trp domain-containing protein
MKHARNEVTVEGALELPRVIETLEALVAALKTGQVQVQHDGESIVLGPRGILGFELSASEKGKRQRLALEFTWRKFSAADTDFDLSIKPGPTPTLTRVISDYTTDDGEPANDSEASETSEPAATAESAGEAHEGEALQGADVYLQHPRGGNNGVSKDTT